MKALNKNQVIVFKMLASSGILSAIFYVSHVVGGRMVWVDYNPWSQPISDLTASTAVSHRMATNILSGYNFFNLLFCGSLLYFFGKYFWINKIFFSGLVLKTLAELFSTFGYKYFPLADTSWGNSFQNTMHYAITGVIVVSYIVLSLLLAYGLGKTHKHPKMTRFLWMFSLVFIGSGLLTVVATQLLPSLVGLIERINLYSLMVLKSVMAIWIYSLVRGEKQH